MRPNSLCIALFGFIVAAHNFEPENFNVVEALHKNGVSVSSIPSLSNTAGLTNATRCAAACDALQSIFGTLEIETRSEANYTTFINAYWSGQQREISPQCIFRPAKATEVSTSILISRLTQCPFAVKSGGHSSITGGSNIQGGITITLEQLNKTIPAADKKSVIIQPGQTWGDVYGYLDTLNLTAIGGRASSIGVGGLTLGGGISYFSALHGLACDNVLAYELVTASGVILNVTADTYPDLYFALRGGGNNFGIVTQFTSAAYSRPPDMWGGMRIHLESETTALINAFYNLALSAKKDPKAHQILSFAWSTINVAQVELEYTENNPNASVLAEYNAIPNVLLSYIGPTTLTKVTKSLDGLSSMPGLRQSFWTFSTQLDKDVVTGIKDIFYEEVKAITNVEGLVPAVALQVLSEPILEKTTRRGGNALGLDPHGGPILVVLIQAKWKNKADDNRIVKFSLAVRDKALALAASKNKSAPYLYMNYASEYQDPFAGYGATNKAKLQSISKKYDPTGVFEKLQPGYFKLNGPPKSM